jgi:Respiratory-chain NADH dehydrogenase, 30 Kd subunit
MKDFEKIPAELGLAETWQEKNGSQWLSPAALDVRRMAELMLSRDARFVTITAMELPDDGGIRMDYHWDMGGELLTFTTMAAEKTVASIYDLCPAADWIEREVHEYFAVDFTGREYEPLMLRAGETAGVNLHKEDE